MMKNESSISNLKCFLNSWTTSWPKITVLMSSSPAFVSTTALKVLLLRFQQHPLKHRQWQHFSLSLTRSQCCIGHGPSWHTRQACRTLMLKITNQTRNLGVVMDSFLNLNSHIKTITKSDYCHLKNTSSIRGLMSQQDLEKLVHAFIYTLLL